MWIDELRTLRKEKLIGREVLFFSEIDSTNREAHDRAEKGAREGTVVIADSQSRGKGRRGRSWESPSGSNLYLSIILRPLIPPPAAPQITLLAGIAAARALSGVSGLECRIKWPNDILLRGRKLAGILAEMEGKDSKVRFIILGVGVNVNWRREDFPDDLRQTATSLRAETGKEISRAAVAAGLLHELEEEYVSFLREGFSARIREEWSRLSWVLGKPVTLSLPEATISGRALGLDPEGALLVLDGEGKTHRFIAGEVSLRMENSNFEREASECFW
jgi:BirA family transcriptional regulator, biotin operon repressor / biotin---[acetyl-CoA-carboxylase] ligase